MKFVGVRNDVDIDFSVVNKARQQRFPVLVRAIENVMERYDMSRLLESEAIKFLSKIFFKISQKDVERERLKKDVVDKLRNLTKDNVVKLNKLLVNHGFIDEKFDLLRYWGY